MEYWRLVDSGKTSAHYNMALDEALADSVRKEHSPPTLRFYGWDVFSVTLGCFQRSSELDLDYCEGVGIPVVRRPTGGRGILHGEDVTYSFSASTREGLFSGGLFNSYRKLSAAFSCAFMNVGIPVEVNMEKRSSRTGSPLCFQHSSYGEIKAGRKKIIGSAQKRWPGGLLQQGTIPLMIDRPRLARVFKGSADNIEKTAGEAMAGLWEFIPRLEASELKRAIKEAFEDTFQVEFIESVPTSQEESLAEELLQKKYLAREWNYQR